MTLGHVGSGRNDAFSREKVLVGWNRRCWVTAASFRFHAVPHHFGFYWPHFQTSKDHPEPRNRDLVTSEPPSVLDGCADEALVEVGVLIGGHELSHGGRSREKDLRVRGRFTDFLGLWFQVLLGVPWITAS